VVMPADWPFAEAIERAYANRGYAAYEIEAIRSHLMDESRREATGAGG
ncbi:unnamed protein product, partial [marine sediment metagenome]